ncbi:leucine-rich repeat-containing G-protein coupled receptor 5 isoform X1 [Physeter macrocephalus]|uniref:Leucine-rich repeat-containing G-protein coupled receptor 5 isoform X1 n=1 Tax=Physeter macrocephalus TaxID=9755 RepID=A0A2Y9EYN4_PHYMC|nr:leucine-rich repeat-containing G-protein coupled receptor 5 isoform X1 [Physeter catodon]|eukprot:XP_007111636.1 leucine-rich repeat-containing G-protein coupled receptor 5 isoform X1 [Physeter catodon]
MDTSSVGLLLALPVLLQLAAGGGSPRPGALLRGCPAHCQCEPDGRMLLRVDCSDMGLSELPSNLSVFTSYLDLSMNNISQLPPNPLHGLRFLEELRLAGNALTYIPRGAFAGLYSLKVLMLQNNHLRQVPTEALQNLRSLQSLRLDANHISSVPPSCFSGLYSLRHLWLDDNALTEIPVQAFRSLSALQAMTLALNKIHHIPDYAFRNLSSLVVLHLHNNRIYSLGKKCFDGLHSLETLDLNYNNLDEFPTAIRTLSNLKELGFHSNNIKSIPEKAFVGNPSLITIHFYDNPIQVVGRSAFQHLPELRTLTLNGASQITEFPDLTGTASLESLTLTGAQISSLPQSVCDQLPNLQVLDLSYNLLDDLPSFSVCQKLQKIDLRHNEMCEIRANTFQQLFSLRSLNLAWNKIAIIHPNAFSTLPSLRKLDLSSNRLSSFPVTGLHGLTHLKLTGNHALQSLISSENFPELKVIEMPYAYQCCAFGVCENVYKISNQWNKGDNSSADDLHKKDAGMFQVQDERDLEDFLLDFEEDLKALHSVQCSPSPGPFKLCEYLFGSWLIRIGVWTIAVLALTCNALVTSTVFRAPLYISSVKLLIGLIAVVNMLTGVSSAVLAGVDAFTFGSFAQHGAWWEQGVGCQVVGFLSIFASESSVFLLTLAALERGFSVKCSAKFETKAPFPSLKAIVALCALLAVTIAAVPLLGGSEYSASPLCLPLPFGEPSATGYMVALVLLNSLCFLVMTIAYTKLYCNLEKGDLENIWDCSMVKHIALLLFTNCILYCPVAFLSFSSLLNLTFISPEVIKFILLVIVPLPACLNPLLYILFNPHFKEDLGSLGKQTHFWTRSKHTSLTSINSDDVEKQSCDSTQALVTFTSASRAYDLPSNSGSPPACPMTESCHLSSVAFVPCL